MIVNNSYIAMLPADQFAAGRGNHARTNLHPHRGEANNVSGRDGSDREGLDATAATSIRRFMDRMIRLDVDDELHRVIIKLIDKETGEVIRQIPPEELIELAKKMKDIEGLFVDKEV